MEFWDIYDENKKPTGRTMKRNDWCLKDGEYHLTVLGVVGRPDGTFLITKRVMTKAWAPGWWEVSGGAAQAGEKSCEAVLREVKEETNLDVDDLELFNVADDIQPDRHYITLQVIAKKHTGELKIMEPTKEDEWQWFDLDNLPEKLYSPSRKFIERYLKLRK